MLIKDWLPARIEDVARREGLNSLLTVGADKPMGGYGFVDQLAMQAAVRELPDSAQDRLQCIVCQASSHLWLYLWDPESLPALLDAHSPLLHSLDWPTDPIEFIARCRDEVTVPGTRIYELIADAYGDKLNPGRMEYNGAAGLTLDRYYMATHEPDPSTIYFDQAGSPVARRILAHYLAKQQQAAADPFGGLYDA